MTTTPVRVLVVDDETVPRDALVAALRSEFQVVAARSAADAERELVLRAYDVLVVDHEMPTTTGLEFVRRARATHPGSIAILVVGPRAIDEIQRSRTNEDVFLVLTSPFDPENLRRWVHMAARTSRLKRATLSLGKQVRGA